MDRRKTVIAAVVLALLIGATLWFLVVRPRIIRGPAEGPTPDAKPTRTLTDDRHAALELYMAGPPGLPPTVARVEATLTGVKVKRADGKEYAADAGLPVRVSLQKGIVQKLANDLIPAGPYGEIALTFAPSGSIVPTAGAPIAVFFPNVNVKLSPIDADFDVSRTLAAFFRMDLTDAFGQTGNVPTVAFPKTLPAETYVLGGIFRNDRSIGNVWQIEDAALKDAVRRDTGMDITATSQKGSEGYTPATANPPVE